MDATRAARACFYGNRSPVELHELAARLPVRVRLCAQETV
jgi:hypothetical protein